MRESSIKPAERNLEETAEQLLYSPTDEDRKLKASFLVLVDGNPLLDPANLPMSECERILGRKLLNKDHPGFAAWFLNKDENRQKLEYLFQLSLMAAEDILKNPDPKAQGARVNTIKAVAELAAKFPRQQAPVGNSHNGINMAKTIGAMDKAQLKLLLEKGGQTLELTASKGEPDGQ